MTTYYQEHREEILKKRTERYRNNREAMTVRRKEVYYPTWRAKHGLLTREEYLKNVAGKTQRVLRGRLHGAIHTALFHSRTSLRPSKNLGCSPSHFIKHIESQFEDGMTWENYGTYWEVDHIIPVQAFDLTQPSQFFACSHFTNTRPLKRSVNRQRGNHLAQEAVRQMFSNFNNRLPSESPEQV